MAKKTFRFKNVDKVLANLKRVFKETKQNKQLQKDMGQLIVKRIQLQARRGKPMRGVKKSDGTFPDLSDFSIAARKLLAMFNNFHPAFRANRKKSNVTMTGALVDAVSFRTKSATSGSIEIFISPKTRAQLNLPSEADVFRAFPGKEGARMVGVLRFLKKNKNNKNMNQVYNALLKIDDDYDFLNINAKTNKSINVLVLRTLRRVIKTRGF